MSDTPSSSHRPADEAPETPRPEAEEPLRERPSQDEPNGPLEALTEAAAAEAKVEAGGEGADDAAARLAEMGVEPEGIASGQILGVVTAILLSIFSLCLVLYYLFYAPLRDQTQIAAENVTQSVEIREVTARAVDQLGNYTLTADSAYTIPIERAKRLTAAQYGADTAAVSVPSRQQYNTIDTSPFVTGTMQTVPEAGRPSSTDPSTANAPTVNSEATDASGEPELESGGPAVPPAQE